MEFAQQRVIETIDRAELKEVAAYQLIVAVGENVAALLVDQQDAAVEVGAGILNALHDLLRGYIILQRQPQQALHDGRFDRQAAGQQAPLRGRFTQQDQQRHRDHGDARHDHEEVGEEQSGAERHGSMLNS